MFVINWAKFITELNQSSLRHGYFHVENVGSIFLNKRNIVMEALENLNLLIYVDLKYFEDI